MTDLDQMADVVYGYKDGMALVVDVYTPRDPRVGLLAGFWNP